MPEDEQKNATAEYGVQDALKASLRMLGERGWAKRGKAYGYRHEEGVFCGRYRVSRKTLLTFEERTENPATKTFASDRAGEDRILATTMEKALRLTHQGRIHRTSDLEAQNRR